MLAPILISLSLLPVVVPPQPVSKPVNITVAIVSPIHFFNIMSSPLLLKINCVSRKKLLATNIKLRFLMYASFNTKFTTYQN